MQRDIATPTVLSWNLKIEQEIAPRTTLTVGYMGRMDITRFSRKIRTRPLRWFARHPSARPALPSGTVYYPTTTLANPTLANSTSWVSGGISNYNGLEVDVRRQYANGLQLRGVYTWSKNLDDGSAWNTSVSANTPAFVSFPGNPKVDYGLAATNIAHAAAINGTWELPLGPGHRVLANASTLQNHFVADGA